MSIPQHHMVHVSCRQIYSHSSIKDVQYTWFKQGTGSYLNGLSLNLICPPGVVSKARNNTDDITMSRVRVNLTWGTICQWNQSIREQSNLPTSKDSSAANSSTCFSIKSASLLSNFPRTTPGQCNPHVVLYAWIKDDQYRYPIVKPCLSLSWLRLRLDRHPSCFPQKRWW